MKTIIKAATAAVIMTGSLVLAFAASAHEGQPNNTMPMGQKMMMGQEISNGMMDQNKMGNGGMMNMMAQMNQMMKNCNQMMNNMAKMPHHEAPKGQKNKLNQNG